MQGGASSTLWASLGELGTQQLLVVMPLQGSEQSRDITFPDYTFWGHEYQYLQVGG